MVNVKTEAGTAKINLAICCLHLKMNSLFLRSVNSKNLNMQNILVAIDFDGEDHKLLEFAASFAEKLQSKIWLVHVAAPEPDFIGYDPGPQTVRDDVAEDLRNEHRNLQKMADVLKGRSIEAQALLIQGFTVDSILEKCKQVKADLLIIGSHEHGAFYNFFQENTALELFKRNEIPLLVLPLD